MTLKGIKTCVNLHPGHRTGRIGTVGYALIAAVKAA